MSNAWPMPALHKLAHPQYYSGSIDCERVPLLSVGFVLLLCWIGPASAHDVSSADSTLISSNPGLNVILYGWLGAKHMITGYDHLLFLVGVVYYLREIRDITILVTLFALGHTTTLIWGVLASIEINAFVADAIIGLSVAYKGIDNLGGFQSLFGETPNERYAVFVFGLFHGLGLATKLQDLGIHPDGLLGNLLAFNLGVELGQITALFVVVLVLRRFNHQKLAVMRWTVNGGLVVAGFALMTYQLARL